MYHGGDERPPELLGQSTEMKDEKALFSCRDRMSPLHSAYLHTYPPLRPGKENMFRFDTHFVLEARNSHCQISPILSFYFLTHSSSHLVPSASHHPSSLIFHPASQEHPRVLAVPTVWEVFLLLTNHNLLSDPSFINITCPLLDFSLRTPKC